MELGGGGGEGRPISPGGFGRGGEDMIKVFQITHIEFMAQMKINF